MQPNARPTPEQITAIRDAITIAPAGSYLFANVLLDELDAVTRERDEARKDSARLDWLGSFCYLSGETRVIASDGLIAAMVWEWEQSDGVTLRADIDAEREAK